MLMADAEEKGGGEEAERGDGAIGAGRASDSVSLYESNRLLKGSAFCSAMDDGTTPKAKRISFHFLSQASSQCADSFQK